LQGVHAEPVIAGTTVPPAFIWRLDDPAKVARVGFNAAMRSDGDAIGGRKSKLQSALADLMPVAAGPGNARRRLRRDRCDDDPNGRRLPPARRRLRGAGGPVAGNKEEAGSMTRE